MRAFRGRPCCLLIASCCTVQRAAASRRKQQAVHRAASTRLPIRRATMVERKGLAKEWASRLRAGIMRRAAIHNKTNFFEESLP